MTYQHSMRGINDLDTESRLIMEWNHFWNGFDALTEGDPKHDGMRTLLETDEERGQWPPRGLLKKIREEQS